MAAAESERLPDDQIIGQMSCVTVFILALLILQSHMTCSILLFAATDTTSHMMAQVLQLLAEHPEWQEKVRKEILTARNGQDITYDQLHEMPLLDAICKETLRLYPPTPIVLRT